MTTIEALEAAYQICLTVKSHSDNVLASLESYEDDKADKEWSKQAGIFIKWYEARKQKTNWQDRLTKSMDKLLTEMNKL